jgi:hypothetical protein
LLTRTFHTLLYAFISPATMVLVSRPMITSQRAFYAGRVLSVVLTWSYTLTTIMPCCPRRDTSRTWT